MGLRRREFLVSLLAFPLLSRVGRAAELVRSASYHVDIGILFGLFTFALDGAVDEQVDRTAGRYRVLVAGDGPGIDNRIESEGVIQAGRFTPTSTSGLFRVKGRESRTTIRYDWDQGRAHYQHRSQTFLLGRERLADDVVAIPAGQPLDDIVTATLNYAEGVLTGNGQGSYETFVVRRARPKQEGPDDVPPGRYRAEIVPLRFTVTEDKETGRPVCLLDLTRFSSWASAANPARIVFGANRRPESIHASLILGTAVRITFRRAS
ncbi:MAG: hypothetical protein HY726_21505 [Candidatus Rokubacteria bacterium]|nr:hypothetical protein [Candidatus Rokubacteria bacterium]